MQNVLYINSPQNFNESELIDTKRSSWQQLMEASNSHKFFQKIIIIHLIDRAMTSTGIRPNLLLTAENSTTKVLVPIDNMNKAVKRIVSFTFEITV